MKIDALKDNFIEVFSKRRNILLGLIIGAVAWYVFSSFTASEMIRVNFGYNYLYWQIGVQAVLTFQMAVFFPIAIHKYLMFNSFSVKENSVSAAGSFLGILAAGCSACSITIASFIGLAGVVSLLPWKGLELKFIAVIMLGYSIVSLLLNLKTCKIKIKKN